MKWTASSRTLLVPTFGSKKCGKNCRGSPPRKVLGRDSKHGAIADRSAPGRDNPNVELRLPLFSENREDHFAKRNSMQLGVFLQ
jgi:hypothetical protein